jgi:hypothetical protein
MLGGDVTGSEITLKIMQSWQKEAKIAAMVAVGAMAEKSKGLCAKMISLTDHSLKDLAKMGHPYAKAHPNNPHDPPEQVHTHTGDLLRGLKVLAPRATSDTVTSEVVNTDEKDPLIQIGTQTMIGRPYMRRVRTEHREEILKAGTAAMNDRMSRMKF